MSEPTSAAFELADYATSLSYDQLPSEVRRMAYYVLKDALACAAFGGRFEWSRIAADYVRALGGTPEVQLPGIENVAAPVPQAALLFGVMAHAFELDSLRKPGAGVHPGATLALPAAAYAMAHREVTPAQLVTAIVAGCEVMFRIGAATLHTPEKSGFHAPGLTGAFGAATAIGTLIGLDRKAMTHAYGIAGSLGGGLLAFTKARSGGMVKRLHLGRAAEAGVQAAMLAQRGFEGPNTVLEGKFGLLDAYCSASDPNLLTEGLGGEYEILKTCFKRYAAHITAHTPIEAVASLRAQHDLETNDIEGIELRVSGKLISHHGNTRPTDLASAQYSVPFMTAASLFVDINDPRHINEELLRDERIFRAADQIRLLSNGMESGWNCDCTVTDRAGNQHTIVNATYSGMKQVSQEFIDAKYAILVSDVEGLGPWNELLRNVEMAAA